MPFLYSHQNLIFGFQTIQPSIASATIGNHKEHIYNLPSKPMMNSRDPCRFCSSAFKLAPCGEEDYFSVIFPLHTLGIFQEPHAHRPLRSISVVVMHTGTAVVVRWQILLGGCISSQVHFTGGAAIHACVIVQRSVRPRRAISRTMVSCPASPPLFSSSYTPFRLASISPSCFSSYFSLPVLCCSPLTYHAQCVRFLSLSRSS